MVGPILKRVYSRLPGIELVGMYLDPDGNLPKILEMLSKKKARLSELLQPLEAEYFISGEINTRIAGDPKAKMRELANIFKDGQVDWLDGVSATYYDWHFNVRPSNTEPLLRLNLEAKSKALMEAKRDQMLAIIRS